ncbi:MAG: short-chain dehydrogenase [Spirochaetae bacterium HGW-Spirochaetae-10]|nr:MAG: short-chain dehydrogenase [Spirochaetae bacterium HGW-Spirochaetae-10]
MRELTRAYRQVFRRENNMKFENKDIFIAGGGSGIGLALAGRFLAKGSRVTVFDRTLDQTRLQPLLDRAGDRLRTVKLDVTDEKRVVSEFKKQAGRSSPDLIVNSVGVVSAVDFMNLGLEEFDRVVRVNLFGSRNVALAAGTILQPGSRLALVASLAGIVGSYGYAAYASSKFAVVGLAQVLRMEWKPRGIGVSVICPPEVETPMVDYERSIRPAVVGALKAFAGTLTVDEAVMGIMSGLEREKFLIIPGFRAKFTHLLSSYLADSLQHRIADGIVKKALQGR